MKALKQTAASILLSRFVFVLLIMMLMIEFVKGALLISILPVYFSSVLGLSTFAVGWALSMQYTGDNALRTPLGWLIDRLGYRVAMGIGVAATFGAVLMFAYLHGAGWMIAAAFLLGVGTSPLWPSIMSGVTSLVDEHTRGTVLSVIYVSWMVGTGLGPIVINFFIRGHDYRLAFMILIGLMVAASLMYLLLPAKPGAPKRASRLVPYFKPRHSKVAFLRVSRQAELPEQRVGWLDYVSELSRSLRVSKLFYVALFAQTFALGILTPVVTLYAREVLQLSPQQFSLFLMFGGAVTVGALLPVGKLVDKLGHHLLLHLGFPIAAAALFWFVQLEYGALLYAAVGLIGLGYALIIPAWNAMIASVVPEQKRGAAWGFILTIEGAGMISGPILSGKVWDAFGPQFPFLLSSSVLVLLFAMHGFISHNKLEVVR